jgi:predicted kinase
MRLMQIAELSAGSEPRIVEEMQIPPDALVVLVGASGCGKSTFARRHFTETQVVSSDECRRLVADDAGNQAATREAFAVFYTLVRGRLTHGRLTVADATNLSPRSREKLRQAADSRRRPRIAIALDVPLEVCVARQTIRARQVRRDVVERGHAEFQQALRDLPREGFAHVYVVQPEDTEIAGPIIHSNRIFDVDKWRPLRLPSPREIAPPPDGRRYRYGDFPELFWDCQPDVEIDPESPAIIRRVLTEGSLAHLKALIGRETLVREFPNLQLSEHHRRFWELVLKPDAPTGEPA